MNLEVKMCHSHLVAMLLSPTEFQQAVSSYTATSPNVEHEGMAGYIETTVKFTIKDLSLFSSLYTQSRSLVTPEWYNKVLSSLCVVKPL